ncbi:uncharacterized protein PAC_12927 [Phialocephala subalpina]|uniref:Uncharacterized protein n=1 Tax=Phialocephala subalpina TaxID=576137 RepID=A0A1L7XDA7_9HELO|nr:uncharacterized protein PAC_12927 [Phialocephala subalpina]
MDSQGQSSSRGAFFLEFPASGPKDPARNKVGEEIWQLWRIWDKRIRQNGTICFEIQYWEDYQGENNLLIVPVSQIEASYPSEAAEWEERFGAAWSKQHSRPSILSARKRDFDDTPSKDKQQLKRSKSEDELAMDVDSPVGRGRDSPERIDVSPPRVIRARRIKPSRDHRDDRQGSDKEMPPPPAPVQKRTFLNDPARRLAQPSTPRANQSSRRTGGHTPIARNRVASSMFRSLLTPSTKKLLEDPRQARRLQDLRSVVDQMSVADGLKIILDESVKELEEDMALGDVEEEDAEVGVESDEDFDDELLISVPIPAPRVNYRALDSLLEKGGVPMTRKSECPCIYIHYFVNDYGIPPTKAENPALKRALDSLLEKGGVPMTRKSECPCIYIHYFVNDYGIPPTKAQVLVYLQDAEDYVDGYQRRNRNSKLAFDIDSQVGAAGAKWTQQDSDDGKRRYCTKDKTGKHKATILEWIKQTKIRLHGLPLNSTIPRAFTEVGYAKNPVDRLYNHAKHVNSNYIMNLMEAIAIKHGHAFRNKQWVILHCVHPTHGMYGEILLSRFALGYITQGGGFSHFQAGVSVGSAKDVPWEHYALKQKEIASLLETTMKDELVFKDTPASLYENTFKALKDQADLGKRMVRVNIGDDASQTSRHREETDELEKYLAVLALADEVAEEGEAADEEMD